MIMRATPGYRDLFGGEASVEGLLAGIPSDIVIKIVSWLNAQFLHASAPIERDRELRKEATRSLSRQEIAQLGERLMRNAGYRDEPRIFHCLYLTYFLHHELTHFRDLPEISIGAKEELRIFKAYLVIVDIFNDQLEIPEVDINSSDDEYFSQRTWPMLFKQHEFNRDVDPILELTRLYLLLDELKKSKYAKYLTAYCELRGCKTEFDLVGKFLGILRVSNKSNDGKNRVNRLESVPAEYYPLLDSLSHPTDADSAKWTAGSLKSLKQFPLYKAAVGEYHILNWNYFYRSAHQAILRDFHATSGIVAERKNYGDFKNWVGKEVTEKRLFRTVLEMAYARTEAKLVFPDESSEEKPDAYVRHGRYVVMLECKDTDVADVHQSEFDYVNFLKELRKKHVRNDKGDPKSVAQLDRNIRELMAGEFPKELYGSGKPKDMWVLPVLVCDGYLYSAPGVNELLNRFYQENSTSKSAPLTVLTIEYLFRKIVDLHKESLLDVLQRYNCERGRRRRKFRSRPTPENAFELFASIEEVCHVSQLPYKAHSGFIREFYDRLGLPTGLKEGV